MPGVVGISAGASSGKKAAMIDRTSGLFVLALVCFLAGLACGARPGAGAEASARDFSSASFYVFVPSRTAPNVSVIDKTTDRLIGRIALPLVPRQIVVSEATHLLGAIDGTSNRIVLVNLASGQSQEVGLAIAPQKLWLDLDGTRLAAVDLWGGTIAFVDLVQPPEQSHVRTVVHVAGPIRDVLFSFDAANLFVAADGLDGIGVIDIARSRMLASIPSVGSGKAHITGLTRSPEGLYGYAADEGGGVTRFEQAPGRPSSAVGIAKAFPAGDGSYVVAPIGVGIGVAKAFPTGYGEHLVAPNNRTGTVTLVATASSEPVATLPGLPGMSTVYSGWFDEVSIVTSATEHRLLVVDLDRLTAADAIVLPGVPGPGNVTDDSSKLYVPIADANEIAVIDLRNRRLLGAIPVDPEPTAVVMTRSFDVCH